MLHQSVRLLTGRLLPVTSGICRQQTSRCSSHPVQKIQTDSDLGDDKEQWKCWQVPIMLLNCFLFTPIAVWSMNLFISVCFPRHVLSLHSSLHILTENLQIPKAHHFDSCRQGAGGKQRANRQTWVWPADSHGPSAAHLALHPSSKQTNNLTLQLCFSSLSLESSPPSPNYPIQLWPSGTHSPNCQSTVWLSLGGELHITKTSAPKGLLVLGAWHTLQ